MVLFNALLHFHPIKSQTSQTEIFHSLQWPQPIKGQMSQKKTFSQTDKSQTDQKMNLIPIAVGVTGSNLFIIFAAFTVWLKI